jgi:hypothetical protein
MRTKDQMALEEAYSSVLNESHKKHCCDECKKKKKKTPCCGKKTKEEEELKESVFADVSVGKDFIEAMSFWVAGLGTAAAAAGAVVGGSNLLRVIAKYKEKNNMISLLNNPEIKPLYNELRDIYNKYKETKNASQLQSPYQKKSNEIKQKISEIIGIEAHGEDSSKYHMAVKKALEDENNKTENKM